MGATRPPKKAKLLCGLIWNDVDLMRRARQLLERRFGPTDLTSDRWRFDATAYYEAEMGPGLIRQFVSFDKLIHLDAIVEIKRTTNDIEAEIAEAVLTEGSARPVNLDPGYVTLSKLVLATTKNYSHRIYLGRGIYAEVTLHYESGGWQAWPWTYADYADGRYFGFLTEVRDRLKAQLSAEVPTGRGWDTGGATP